MHPQCPFTKETMFHTHKKGKVFPFHAMQTYRRNRDTDAIILDLALKGGVLLASRSAHFTSRKESMYPWNRSVGGPHSQHRCFGKEKNELLPRTGI
jgi:hypothetical protein